MPVITLVIVRLNAAVSSWMHLSLCVCVCMPMCTIMGGPFFFFFFLPFVCNRPFPEIRLGGKIIVMLEPSGRPECKLQCGSIHSVSSGGSKDMAVGYCIIWACGKWL